MVPPSNGKYKCSNEKCGKEISGYQSYQEDKFPLNMWSEKCPDCDSEMNWEPNIHDGPPEHSNKQYLD